MTDEADEFSLVDCQVDAIKNSLRTGGSWINFGNVLNYEEGIAVNQLGFIGSCIVEGLHIIITC